jgi:hypothetical protein
LDYLEFDRLNPIHALTVLPDYLGSLKGKKEQSEATTGALLIGGVLLLILISSRGGSSGPDIA